MTDSDASEAPVPVPTPTSIKDSWVIYYGRSVEEMMALRLKWVRMPAIQYVMVNYLAGRETAFLSPSRDFSNVRHCKVHSVKFLNMNLDAFGFFKKDYNVYYSLASFRNHPVFSFAPPVRAVEQKEFNKDVTKFVTGYDFVLDFDAHGVKFKEHKKSVMWRDCKIVLDDFDKYGVRYFLKFSGNGFHVRVPYEEFSTVAGVLDDIDFGKDGNVYNFCKRVRERMVALYALSTVDMRLVEVARIWKAEWSYVVPYGTIARPLSRQEFDRFDLSLVDPLELLKLPFSFWFKKPIEYANMGRPGGFVEYARKRLRKW